MSETKTRWPEGEYTLLANKHYDRELQTDFSRGDVIYLNKEDALRLGLAKCIAPVDAPEAIQARANPDEVRRQRISEMEAEIERLKLEEEDAE